MCVTLHRQPQCGLERADILMSDLYSLTRRAHGITEGDTGGLGGYMESRYDDYARPRTQAAMVTDRVHPLSGSHAAVLGQQMILMSYD